MTPFNWTKWWFWLFFTHGVADAILGNGYGIEGQNYVAMSHISKNEM